MHPIVRMVRLSEPHMYSIRIARKVHLRFLEGKQFRALSAEAYSGFREADSL